jgi:hypothetical protein
MTNPRHDERFFKYQRILLSKISPKTQKGLEIGVLDLPFITPDMGIVQYADHFPTEELRERAAQAPGHSPDFVQPIDFVLSVTPLETLPFDYEWIATAHLIEHVPNLIGWLNTIGDRLLANGLLFCVIPDGRYTFDINRPLSTLGKILQDHLENRKIPSFCSVFDAHYYNTSVSSPDIWQGKATSDPLYHNSVEASWAAASRALETYIDCHVNIFTPVSFAQIIRTLSERRFIPFYLEEVGETEPNGIDFHAVLRKSEFEVEQLTSAAEAVRRESATQTNQPSPKRSTVPRSWLWPRKG